MRFVVVASHNFHVFIIPQNLCIWGTGKDLKYCTIWQLNIVEKFIGDFY